MVKLPMDLQRTKESSGGCQRSSNSQVDAFKLFPLAVAGERHDGAVRVGTFGGAMPVVDGVLSGGQMGSPTSACGRGCTTFGWLTFGWLTPGGSTPSDSSLSPCDSL